VREGGWETFDDSMGVETRSIEFLTGGKYLLIVLGGAKYGQGRAQNSVTWGKGGGRDNTICCQGSAKRLR